MPAAEIAQSPLTGVDTAWHAPEWAETVSRVFGFEDCSLRDEDGCLPLFLSRSPWMGTKLVSAVFNGYASPLARSDDALARLVSRAVSIARERRVDWLEIKGVSALPPQVVADHGLEVRRPYWLDVLPLSGLASAVGDASPAFRKHLRRMQRRASEAGVRIEASGAPADLDDFHGLLVRRNRDRFATLAQPRSLLRALGASFFARDAGRLFVARSASGRLLAGALFLERGGSVASGFLSAAEPASRALSLDTLVKHSALVHYAEAGFGAVDFGLTSPSQTSLLESKARFGTQRTRSFRCVLPVESDVVPDYDYATSWSGARRAFRFVPLPVARRLPELLAPYLN